MTTKEMTELYNENPSKWTVFYFNKVENGYLEISDPSWNRVLEWKIVEKDDIEFLDAYNNGVEVEFCEDWGDWTPLEVVDFIEEYNHNYSYRIATDKTEEPEMTKEEEDEMTEEINNFKEFGYRASFEGDIFHQDDFGFLSGCVYINGKTRYMVWDQFGKTYNFDCHELTYANYDFTLEVIEKDWFDIPGNFPALMFSGETQAFFVCPDKETYLEYINEDDRLATQEEIDSMYYMGR